MAGLASLLLVGLAAVSGMPVAGQESPGGRFSAGVQLVEVYASVTDGSGAPVTGLGRDDFQLREDGRPQEIETFAAGEFPLTVALGVDHSFSMAGAPLRQELAASRAFLDALRPGDRSLVVGIGTETELFAPLSEDRAAQRAALGTVTAWGTTALFDGIVTTLDRLDPEPGRQALVVFSDGTDRYSRTGAAAVAARVRRSRALVYPIAIARRPAPILAELAALSGGRSFLIRDPRALEPTLAAIARELRYQYLLGYAPVDAETAGAWRSIRVELTRPRPGVRVRARDGYVSN